MRIARRRLVLILLAILLFSAGLVVLSPFWVQWIARPLAARNGITWERMEPSGYTGYELDKLSMAGTGFLLEADSLAVPQPVPWLAFRFGYQEHAIIEAGRISILLQESTDNGDRDRTGIGILNEIRSALEAAAPWIPEIRVAELVVVNPDGRTLLRLEGLKMDGNDIRARIPETGRLPRAEVHLHLGQDVLQLRASSVEAEEPLLLLADLDPSGPSANLLASLEYRGKVLRLSASIPSSQWIPEKLDLTGREWPLPMEWLGRAGLPSAPLLADIELHWKAGSFSSSLRVAGTNLQDQFLPGQTRADIEISGNLQAIEFTRLFIDSHWLQGELSSPVQFDLVEERFAGSARFSLTADLARQDWIPADGIVQAEVAIDPGRLESSALRFSLSGQQLVLQGQAVDQASATGTLDYPLLQLQELQVAIPGYGSVSAMGELALDNLQATGSGQFSISQDNQLPYLETVNLQAPLSGFFSVEGPLSSPAHHGRIDPFELHPAGLHPMTVSASWEGTGTSDLGLLLQLRSNQSSEAEARVRMRRSADQAIRIEVEDLSLVDPEIGLLTTETAFEILLHPGQTPVLQSISGFRMTGHDARLALDFNAGDPSLRASLSGFTTGPLEGWLDQAVPPLRVEHLEASLDQLDPFLRGEISLQLNEPAGSGPALVMQISGKLDGEGIHLGQVEASLGEEPLLRGFLELPLLLHPWPADGSALFSPISGNRLSGNLEADISREVSRQFPGFGFLEEFPGLQFDIQAEGSPEAPTARISGSISDLAVLHHLDPRLQEYPLEQVDFNILLSRELVEVQHFRILLREAEVSLHGRVPAAALGEAFTGDDRDWLKVAGQADFEANFINFRSRGFASLLPAFMRPTGLVNGNLQVRPGLHLSGNLSLRNFSLRPTLYSQTIEGITAILDIEESRISISEAGARVGRSSFDLEGFIDLQDFQNPTFALVLTGQRLSLLRTPDMILFGDVKLVLDGETIGEPVSLSGEIGIRDSLLLMEIDPLAAQTTGPGLAKPPFFSIDQDPFRDWVLDIGIAGQDCLRFKSPYAKALLSVQVDLEGTLGSPVWVGSVSSSEGAIDFPGLRTSLSRSELFMTRQRQDQLQLDLNSIGQVSSYVISMNVRGTVDDPHVSFASTPELANAQILQLLATGSTSRSGISSVGLYLGRSLLIPGAGRSLWDRISVEIGRDITESSKDTIDLYYDISDRWRLHGEYDKYDAQNLNLEWEVFSK